MEKNVVCYLLTIIIASCIIQKVNAESVSDSIIELAQPKIQSVIERGIAQRDAGNINDSIKLLREGLNSDPSNSRIKIELALSYYYDNDYSSAKHLAEDVLSEVDLPEVVRGNIIDFLAQINLASSDSENEINIPSNTLLNRVSYKNLHKINFFSGYDSNANIAPQETQIDIGVLPKTVLERSDHFFGGFYDYSRVKLYQNQANNIDNPSVTLGRLYQYQGFTIYAKKYDDVDSSDILYANGRIGLRYNFSDSWYTKTKADITYIELGEKSLVNYYRIDGELGYSFSKSTIALTVSDNYRDYLHEDDEPYQGHNLYQGVNYNYKMSSQLDILFQLGNRDVNRKDKAYAYDSIEMSLATQIYLGDRVKLNLSSEYNRNSYRRVQKYYDNNRMDRIYRYRLNMGLLQVYPSLDMDISYSYVVRVSNHDINEYDQGLVMLMFKYKL